MWKAISSRNLSTILWIFNINIRLGSAERMEAAAAARGILILPHLAWVASYQLVGTSRYLRQWEGATDTVVSLAVMLVSSRIFSSTKILSRASSLAMSVGGIYQAPWAQALHISNKLMIIRIIRLQVINSSHRRPQGNSFVSRHYHPWRTRSVDRRPSITRIRHLSQVSKWLLQMASTPQIDRQLQVPNFLI